MQKDKIWSVSYEFSGRVPNDGFICADAVCYAMANCQVFSLTDGVIVEALRILGDDWDKKSLLKTIENCSFDKY